METVIQLKTSKMMAAYRSAMPSPATGMVLIAQERHEVAY